MSRGRSIGAAGALLVVLTVAGAAHSQPVAPRRAEIREQTMGLLAARLRAEVGLSDGQVELRVVRVKGVEHRLRSGRGDQLVVVTVEIPARISPRARELIEELGRELGEDVQPQQQGFLEKLRGLFG